MILLLQLGVDQCTYRRAHKAAQMPLLSHSNEDLRVGYRIRQVSEGCFVRRGFWIDGIWLVFFGHDTAP